MISLNLQKKKLIQHSLQIIDAELALLHAGLSQRISPMSFDVNGFRKAVCLNDFVMLQFILFFLDVRCS